MYDVIIIGSGPAGLTAGIYLRRADKNVFILEKESFGGQINFSPRIENYPGFNQTSGAELAEKLVSQALDLGVEIELDEAKEIVLEGKIKKVIGESGTYEAKAVIIATGAKHRLLGLEGEEELIGNGISFCAVCDGAFYADKDVVVVGGGNSALQEAVLLADVCKSVTMVQNLSVFTGEKKLLDILEGKNNVKFITDSVVTSFIVDDSFKGVSIKNTANGEESNILADGAFIAIGQVPQNEIFKSITAINETGYIVADETCITDTDGIFVAGDCRTKAVRQIVTATADGATAALKASRFVEDNF